MKKEKLSILALCFSLFMVPLASHAATLDNEELHNSELVNISEEVQGVLPSGTEFTFGVPFYTNEFSQDDSFEWVTIDSEVQAQPTSKSEFSTYRIEPGWATYISKAYWIDRD